MEEGSELRRAQLVMLRLLKIFDHICKKHGLKYWLDAGTLLGARRHGGFIPWDDDLDVMMPLPDYQKLLEIAPGELPYDIFFQTNETDPEHEIDWAKLRDRFSYMDDPGGPYPYSQGIPIDIFPAFVQTKRQFKFRILNNVLPPFSNPPYRTSKRFSFMHNMHNLIIGIMQRIFILFMKAPSLKKGWISWGEKCKTRGWVYNPSLPWYQFFPLDIVEPLGKIKFEDAEFPAPNNVEEYLRIYYGEWQTPPKNPTLGNHGVNAIHLTDAGPKPHSTQLKWKDYH